jgi:hypothetical protein
LPFTCRSHSRQLLHTVNMVKKADMGRNKSALSVAASEMSGYTG